MATCPVCKNKKASFFAKKDPYSYYLCTDCGTVFLDPAPTQKFIDHFYDKGYPYQVDSVSSQRMRENAVQIMDRLLHLNPAGRTLLDVGSGYGDFLEAVKDTGIKGVGIEPAVNLYKFSRKRNLSVTQATLNEFSAANANLKFDFITVIHLIEHVKNPSRFVSQCLVHLKKGGVMYIETPNVSSHLFQSEKQAYTFLTPPDHTILLSPISLKKILVQNKLEILDLHTFSYPEHAAPLFRKRKKVVKGHIENPVQSRRGKPAQRNSLKYFLGNKLLYPAITPFLNIGNKGSILACYLKKTE